MRLSAGMVLGLSLLPLPESASAQIRASERATVSQTIDGTVITIDYARPRLRGRSRVFGDEVKWEEIWTPGANMATTLEVSKPIQINGHPVPKGKYSVWIQVTQDDWTFMLDTVVNRFHTVRPKPDSVMLRFDFRPEQKQRMDVLTWWFPEVKSDRAVLAMQWDKYYVPLSIRVESSFPLTVGAEAARPIVGSYEMHWAPAPVDTTVPKDTTAHEHATSPADDEGMKLEITYERGSLWAHVDPAPFPGYDTMLLLRMKDDWYVPGWWMNGELYDASDEMIMEFKIENGKATGFDMRTKDDMIVATASRTR
jgi:hypothetical protein